MNFRLIVALTLLALPAHAETTRGALNLNVDGQDGTPGRDGSNGFSGIGYGANGGPGQKGGPGGAARPAGNIKIGLVDEGGKAAHVKGTDNGPVDERIGITSPIRLSAQGGNGGRGGRGGDGGHGATGYPAGDANRSSDGSPGGPGGNGGPGGDGGVGGAAGEGGLILVQAPFEDIHLFSLIEAIRTEAGNPGPGGSGGDGGAGGAGGRRGQDYSWETQESYQEDDTETYRNSDGTTSTRVVTTTKMRSVSHTNHGGSAGLSGWAGSSGSTGSSGPTARNGEHFYIIDYGDGKTERFKRLYNLGLNPYQVVDETGDGIFEPGEPAEVQQISVRSTEDMPTPPPGKSNIRIWIPGDRWHRSDGGHLELPRSLRGSQSHRFEQALGFHVTDILRPSVNEPLHESMTIDPAARLNPVDRGFSDFSQRQTHPVQFPVRFKLDAPPALAAGQQGRIRFHVSNISQKSIGSDSGGKREVELFLQDRPASEGEMTVFDQDGNSISLREGLLKVIRNLGPGETQVLEGSILVPDHFEAQTAYSFDGTGRLSHSTGDKKLRPVQLEEHRLSVASRYVPNPNADIALIVNHQTTPEELGAWTHLLENRLGFHMESSWNVSYYANLDLDAERIEEPLWKLSNDFAGESIILLNNEIKSYSGRRLTPWNHLSKKAFLKSIGQQETGFLVLGERDTEDAADLLTAAMVNTNPGEGSRVYSSEEALIAGLEVQHRTQLSPHEKNHFGEDFHRVQVVGNYYWFDPTEAELKNRASALKKRLDAKWPERRYAVDPVYKAEMVKKGWMLRSNRVYLGDITVRRLPDATDRVATMVYVPEAKLHQPSFILSDENLRHVLSNLPTHQKLAVFDRTLTQISSGESSPEVLGIGEAIVDALLADIVEDYEPASRGALSRGTHSPRTIARLHDWRFQSTPAPGSESERLVRRLYVRARLAGHYNYSFFSLKRMPKAATVAARQDLDAWIQSIYSNRKDRKAFLKRVNTDWAELEKQVGIHYWSWNSDKDRKLKTAISEPGTSPHRVSTNEILKGSLLFTEGEYAQLRRQDLERREAWEKLFDADQEARKRLKLDPGLPSEVPDSQF